MDTERDARPRRALPAWQREAAWLRRVTTSVVAVVATGALATSLSQQPASASQEAPGSEGQVVVDGATDAADQGQKARAGYDPSTQTVDVSDSATAEGTRETAGTVYATGSTALGSTPEYAALTQAIGAFEDKGYSLSITLVDLDTGRTLGYRSSDYYYSASSIKAPFAVAGYELLVDAGSVDSAAADPLTRRALVASDNDAYLALRDLFGSDAFATWLTAAGVDAGYYPDLTTLAQTHYPHLSTDQMAAMWRHAYGYLSQGGESAEKIVSWLRQRQVSPIKEALGDSLDTWSKAGWIDFSADGDVQPATWDAGVVLSPEGTYVLAVASDAPSDLSALVPVVRAADAVHAALVAS